jgi:hypothetical protein
VTVLYRDGPYPTCRQWREKIVARLTEAAPDLVVMSNASTYEAHIVDEANRQVLSPVEGADALREGWRKTIRQFLALGSAVLIIRDNPIADANYQTCYLKGLDCITSRQRALAGTQLAVEVAREFGDFVTVADFSDEICDAQTCPVMRNGLIVYRDSNHLTATYAATFAPQIAELLRGFAEKLTPQGGRRTPEPGDAMTSALGQEETKAPN